jgi:signal transduction histidine kinase
MTEHAFLFVDDDPLFRDLLRNIAEEAFPGADIVTLEDATTVAEVCALKTFDCVVLDHNMPGVTGFETAKCLRRAFPYLPIILITGAGDEMLAARALKGGVNDYIPKSRLSAGSMRRVLEYAMETMSQRRIIDAQREDLETFAFALAHDIKQPLRQISTFSDLLAAEIELDEKPDAAKFLRFIRSASGRLTDLIDAMLDYSIQSQLVSVEDVDLDALIRDVCLSLNNYIEEREGRIDIQADFNLVANKALLAQILQNLIINGLKYNRSPTPTVSIKVALEGDYCGIVVQDNGIGIEDQYLSEIFKPLRRLHNNDQFTGTGLGLAVVRKAVIAQKGSITCRSELGTGTQFVVKLPQAKGFALQSVA